GNTLVSVSTQWAAAAAMARRPEHCSKTSRMDGSIQLCMVFITPTGTGQYVSVWYRHHARSALSQRLARPGPQNAGREWYRRVEGGSAGEGLGCVAWQLLLAFPRCRRVPHSNARLLARGFGRAGHCRSRGGGGA